MTIMIEYTEKQRLEVQKIRDWFSKFDRYKYFNIKKIAVEIEIDYIELIHFLHHGLSIDFRIVVRLSNLMKMFGYIHIFDGDLISLEFISNVVCNYFRISNKSLNSKNKHSNIVVPRQIAHWFAKTLTKSTFAFIGLKIGNKDHATVLHSVKIINNMIETKFTTIDGYYIPGVIKEIGEKLKQYEKK